jgi:hypothetical protein
LHAGGRTEARWKDDTFEPVQNVLKLADLRTINLSGVRLGAVRRQVRRQAKLYRNADQNQGFAIRRDRYPVRCSGRSEHVI